VHQDDVGVAASADLEGLAGAYGDHVQPARALLLEGGQNGAESRPESAVLVVVANRRTGGAAAAGTARTRARNRPRHQERRRADSHMFSDLLFIDRQRLFNAPKKTICSLARDRRAADCQSMSRVPFGSGFTRTATIA